MTDHPIIFSAPMVRALLDGRKTMTRRLAWRDRLVRGEDNLYERVPSPWQKVKPGDRLWVRESFFNADAVADYGGIHYRATAGGELQHPFKWTPSIHMPRWASRLTLTVTAVKIERLQEISNEDARAEGVDCWPDFVEGRRDPFPAMRFRDLWASLHGMDSWDTNPEVVAISFKVIKANIHSLEKEQVPR